MADGISFNVKGVYSFRDVEDKLKAEDADDKKLKQACDDFEAVFIGHMLKTMRQTVGEDSLFGKSHSKEIYTSLFDQELATKIARSDNSLGLGDKLYQELKDGKEPDAALHDPVKASFQRNKE